MVEISADELAGILPPPLTEPVGSLIRDELFDLHMARLAALSLHPNVYLKVLPPVVENKVETWYDDKKELDKVIKAYRKSDLHTPAVIRLTLLHFRRLTVSYTSH